MNIFLLMHALLMTNPALAATKQVEGLYAEPTHTWYFAESRKSCLEDGGKPIDQEDTTVTGGEGEEMDGPIECIVPADNTVTVEKSENDYQLSITTWGSNTHSCNFEGKAKLDGDILVSEENIMEEGICRIEVKFLTADSVTVSSTGDSCRLLCGARAWGLDIAEAIRK